MYPKLYRDYSPIKSSTDDDRESDSFLPRDATGRGDDDRSSRFRTLRGYLWPLFFTSINILLTATTAGLLVARNLGCDCSEKALNTYSPVYDKIDISMHEVHFNNTFWVDAVPSIYQKRPSPEVDMAWGRISDTHGLRLTEEELIKMGKDPESVWPWPAGTDGYQGAEPTYAGLIDVFHQTHCLDMLRRTAWPEYYGDLKAIYSNMTFPFEDHLLHCQYLLLNVITCHADVEVATFHKIKGFKGPFVNFEMDRKCRSFSDILSWKEENQVEPDDRFFETPEGIVQLEAVGLALPYPQQKV